jgi:hypothetical protein
MVPMNLKGVPWSSDRANMVLNRIKRDCCDKCIADDVAKGVPVNGVVADMVDAEGRVVTDRAQCVAFRIDPLKSAIRHDGRTVKLMTRRCWALYCEKQRDEALVLSQKPYSWDNPEGQHEPFVMADTVHWDEDDLKKLHSIGMYLSRRPQKKAV